MRKWLKVRNFSGKSSKLFINPLEPNSCKFVSLYTLLTDLCPAFFFLFFSSDGFLFNLLPGSVNELGSCAFAM